MTTPDVEQGTFIYHPLAPGTPLETLWREATRVAGPPPPVASDEVWNRYASHIRARLRGAPDTISAPDAGRQDRRRLVELFRRFWPTFLRHIGAPEDRASIPVVFPKLDLFDARLVQAKEVSAIFVSSRMLDVIELFADTVAMCVRLNGLAAPAMIGYEENPPPVVTLAWQPFLVEGIPGLELYHLQALPTGRKALREKVFEWAFGGPPPLLKAVARWRLAQYLAQMLLVSMEHAVNSNAEGLEQLFSLPVPPPPVNEPASLDSRYLACIVLAFVVLHEHCHLLHQHDSLAEMEPDPLIDEITERSLRAAEEIGATATDLRGSRQRFEQDADCFAIEAVPDEFRDAMLETASLWFMALASADRGGVGWLENSMSSEGRAYPQYAMRVWFLNGRYSTGRRQGVVAQEARQTAEAVERRPSARDFAMDQLLPRFGALWDLARRETGSSGLWMSIGSLLERMRRA